MAQNKAVLGKDKQPCVINLKMRLLAPGDKESPGGKASPGAKAAATPDGVERDSKWEVRTVPLGVFCSAGNVV